MRKRTMAYIKVTWCKYSCTATSTMAPIIMFHFQPTWKVRCCTPISFRNSIMEKDYNGRKLRVIIILTKCNKESEFLNLIQWCFSHWKSFSDDLDIKMIEDVKWVKVNLTDNWNKKPKYLYTKFHVKGTKKSVSHVHFSVVYQPWTVLETSRFDGYFWVLCYEMDRGPSPFLDGTQQGS